MREKGKQGGRQELAAARNRSAAAETSLDAASERIATAEDAAALIQYGLLNNLVLVAALISLLTGSGFLYYKMTWTEDRWSDDDDGDG